MGRYAHAKRCSRCLGHERQEKALPASIQFAEAVSMMGGNDRRQEGTCLARTNRQDGRVGQDVAGRSLRGHVSVLQDDHGRGKPRDFRRRMADVKDRDVQLVAQSLEIGKDLRLARFVQRRQRFVRQDQARRGQQRPSDGNALLFAARQGAGPPLGQVADPEKLHHLVEWHARGRVPRCKPGAIGKILTNRQMRKQTPLLENVSDPAAMRHKPGSGLRVEQDPVADANASTLRGQEAGNRIDDGRLAGTGTAEQGGDALRCRKRHVERKRTERMAERNGKGHVPAILRATARLTHSDRKSAVRAMAMAMNTSRAASFSPPGTWRKL